MSEKKVLVCFSFPENDFIELDDILNMSENKNAAMIAIVENAIKKLNYPDIKKLENKNAVYRLPENLHQKLKLKAKKHGRSISKLIIDSLND